MKVESDIVGNNAIYDDRNNLIEIKYKDGSWNKYQYDSQNRLIHQETSDGETERITYYDDSINTERINIDLVNNTKTRRVYLLNNVTGYNRILTEEFLNGKLRRRVVTEIFPESN